MQVQDVMTRAVLTVPPTTPVATLAALFAERGVSGVPVTDGEGRLLGLVTEGDMLRRLAAPAGRPRPWYQRLLDSAPRQAEEFARIHGRHAQDVMSTELVTATPEMPVEEAAALLERHRIRRLPVLRDGRLAGLLSRADLMRAMLAPPASAAADTPDEEIRARISKALWQQPWVDAFYVFATVERGIVTFHGFCRSPAVERALRVLAEGVPGVRGVKLELSPSPALLPAD
ncbi:CBS domain-containing protein [Pseudoroseomonas cervicalis]|uniref:CBS domain-containing protein n=1 Tax=Teichococcus cervicalis TaxID=204525 RepID=UPI002780E50C|nr:CBS domain-containing protein [Pseudoroseomonas cervicalis]MDQ1078211.1 CBS domain-containing protein [Pseudoroseomonas cervicalis]